MQWTIEFSQLILAVYALSAAIAVGSLLVVCRVMWMRRRAGSREKRLAEFRATWQTLLRPRDAQPGLLPAVAGDEIPTFMMLWNLAHADAQRLRPNESAHARSYLNDVARRLGMDAAARRCLRKRDVALRLQAIDMLGNLGEQSAAPALVKLVDAESTILSLAAARALLHIDSIFVHRFITLLGEGHDWPAAKVRAIVQEDRAILEQPMIVAVRTSEAPAAKNLVEYLQFFDRDRSLPVVRYLLGTTTYPALLTAALRVLGEIGERSDANAAAAFLGNSDWRVRVQATNAIGKLGDGAQIPMLATLMDDAHWWVRYRAAQALSALAKDDAALANVVAGTNDRYGRDMLAHVIAERRPILQGGKSA